jgi:hypothetical protein
LPGAADAVHSKNRLARYATPIAAQLRHPFIECRCAGINVQTILGHVHIDTTLGYARLYDGTVAADYYRAMVDIEGQFCLPEDKNVEPMGKAELLAIVDALKYGTLNENQVELVDALRKGILAIEDKIPVEFSSV